MELGQLQSLMKLVSGALAVQRVLAYVARCWEPLAYIVSSKRNSLVCHLCLFPQVQFQEIVIEPYAEWESEP